MIAVDAGPKKTSFQKKLRLGNKKHANKGARAKQTHRKKLIRAVNVSDHDLCCVQ